MLFYLPILIILCDTIIGIQPLGNFYSFESARLLSAIDNEAKARSLELSPSETKIHAKRVRNPSSLFRNTDSGNGNASTKRIAHYYPKVPADSQTSPSASYTKGDTLYAPAESYHHDDYHKHTSHHDDHHHHHQHHHSDHHKGNSHLEYGLLGLSALALGSFLLNSLLNLLALGAGFFFTSTGTATGTATGGTGGGTSTSTGGGIITTTSTSTTSTGGGTAAGSVGLSLLGGGGVTSLSGSGLGSFEALNSPVAAAPVFALSRDIRKGKGNGKRRRRPRSTIHIDVDPFTSFEAMSEFILNSIEAIKHRHECLPYVLCMGNKRAQIIKKGFQYFIPFYSLCAVYMSKDVGLHDFIPEHIRAILRGLSEANCRSELQQC